MINPMSFRTSAPKRTTTALADEPSPLWNWIEILGLILTAGVVIARATMLEIVREPQTTASTALPSGPGATTSLMLSLVACLPALFLLLRRAFSGSYRFVNPMTVYIGLTLGALALASTFWASDQFAALIGASTFFSALVLIWSTAQLVRTWGRFRLVIGVCLGLLCVYVAQGVIYRLVDLPDLVHAWDANIDGMKTDALRAHGWEEGDVPAVRFDRKIHAGEMIGFMASPNTFAATIITLVIILIGLCLQRLRWRESAALIVPVMVIGLAGWLLTYTQSKAALVTPLIAIISFALLSIKSLRGWMICRRRLVFALGVLGCVMIVAMVVGHGWYHGSLVIDSLTFRWRYWIASMHLLADHPVWGVGYANFGDYYTQYRLPIAAEEIRDPHNLFIRFFTELGLFGGILALGWIASQWWAMTRPVLPGINSSPTENTQPSSAAPAIAPAAAISGQDARCDDDDNNVESHRGAFLAAIMAVLLGFGLSLVCVVDFSQMSEVVIMAVARQILYLLMLIIGIALVFLRMNKGQIVVDHRPITGLVDAAIIAVLIFLLHSQIDFVFFETGPMYIFAMLSGAIIAMRNPHHHHTASHQSQRSLWITGTVIAWLIWFIAIGTGISRVFVAQDQAHRGDELARRGQQMAAAARYQEAASILPINSTYAFRAATALIYAGAPSQQVLNTIDKAIDANSRDTANWLLRARYLLRSAASGSPDRSALADFDHAIQLDPQDIDTRVEYAHVLADAGQHAAAAQQARAALAINNAYDPGEEKRLTPEKLNALQAFIQMQAKQ